jgi:hypothetical protein
MQFLLHPVRLATIHPLLAHFTVGGTALFILAYAIGVWKKSAAWTFAGDAILWLTTLFTVGTLAFGMVSNYVVAWPGGLETWRAIHLWLAFLATAILLVVAVARARRWQASPSLAVTLGMLLAASGVAVTGWIGGEVLVFHSGMAVRAAGHGSLAPPVSDRKWSKDFLDAMREARGGWGGINAELSWMLVQQPTSDAWTRLIDDAERMELFATQMAKFPSMGERSNELADEARKIQAAARSRKLGDVAKLVGDTGATCAACHEEERWGQ